MGFTLMELLVVVAIIMVLAAITLSVAGLVQNTAARARTKTELQMLEVALEKYKSEMGEYPTWSIGIDTNTGLPSTSGSVSAVISTNESQNATNVLLLALAPPPPAASNAVAISNIYNPQNKIFFEFPRTMLGHGGGNASNETVHNTNVTEKFVDPYGSAYGYSYPGRMNPSNQFDLWSQAGNSTNTNAWIKNW
ncbi:MAG: hypothetical protein ABIP32_04710 [Chthoniobacterales bacterium]